MSQILDLEVHYLYPYFFWLFLFRQVFEVKDWSVKYKYKLVENKQKPRGTLFQKNEYDFGPYYRVKY